MLNDIINSSIDISILNMESALHTFLDFTFAKITNYGNDIQTYFILNLPEA